MSEYALVNADDVVVNVIVADAEFVDELSGLITNDDVVTGDLEYVKAYNVTGKGVSIGHKRLGNGKFTPPEPPPVAPDDPATRQAAEAAAAQRAADDGFLTSIAAKLRSGKSLTQDERDRKDVIFAQRA